MKKLKEYLLEFAVIFISISVAFLSDNWREELQDKQDYNLILDEIHANLSLDSVEFESDLHFIELQLSTIARLLDTQNPCPFDSLGYYFNILMYNYRWPDVKSTGIDQLRNSKNLDPGSDLISEVNNYYTWTEYLKASTPYQYIMPQNTFNEWMIQNELFPVKKNISQLDPEIIGQLEIRLYNLARSKQVQRGSYSFGLSKIVHLLDLFDQSEDGKNH
jgi:hypothetical protein